MEEVETFEPCSDEHVKEILALDASAHSDWSAISAVTDEEGNTIEVFRQRVPFVNALPNFFIAD